MKTGRRTSARLMVLGVAGALAWATNAGAQSSGAHSISGRWVLVPSSAENSARLASIDAATDDLGLLVRRRVRARITERSEPKERLSISLDAGEFVVRSDDGALTLTVGAPAVVVSGPGGQGRAQARRRGGHLVTTLRGDGGSSSTTYRLSENGRELVLRIRITNERLSRPISFRLTYRRA